MSANPTAEPPDVAKFYTRARRFPQLIGRTVEGTKIPGGPYTYTQAIVAPACAICGYKTMWLWGQFGLIGNAVLLLGVTAGLVWLLGKVPPGSRNPLNIAAGALRAIGAPAHGRLAGVPFRPRPIRRVRGSATLIRTAADFPSAASHRVLRRDLTSPGQRPSVRVDQRPDQDDIPVTVSSLPRLRPTPADTRSRPTPALTGVQRTLAAAAAGQPSPRSN